MLRNSLLVCALAFGPLAATAPAQDLYDTTILRTINLAFHDANWWTLLQQNYTSQTNILADLTMDGVTYPNVGVRIRGNTSYTGLPPGSQKVSLNIDMEFVDPNQALLGHSTLNLNNSFTDPTFCREVAYSNFLARYIPNGRANHVVLTLNGQNWGVYTNVQQWGKSVLRQWFDDEDGMRVKCANNPNGPGLRYVGPSPSSYTGYEIKDTGGLADPVGALISVCNAVTNGSLITWQDIDNVFAIDPSTWDVALENLFSDDDSYINKGCDFVVYRNPVDGRSHLQQTDGNETFKFSTWSPTRNFTSTTKPVLNHVLAVSELRQRYMAHLRAALLEFTWPNFDVEFLSYRALIDAAVQADPKKLYSYVQFVANFNTTVNLGGGPGGGNILGLEQFVTQRLAIMNTDPEVSAPAPSVSNVNHVPSTPAPTDPVWVRATVAPNVHAIAKVELFYLPAPGIYSRTPMRDDGLSNDGQVGDGVYGALLPIAASGGQRVKYYVGATSAGPYSSMSFSPVHTELKPLTITYSFGDSGMRVTEYMYSGTDGEFVELTNTTNAPIDLTGWSLDDDSAVAGTVDLSTAGIVAPGQSILITDVAPAAFASAWALGPITIIGPNTQSAFGRNDQINIFDSNDQLVERLSYGDQTFPGSIRAQNASGQTCNDALGTDNAYAWVKATLNDAWGSLASSGGDLGTPGSNVSFGCNLPIGTVFCAAGTNVSGTQAHITAMGSTAVANASVTLNVVGANPNVPGLFIFGTNQVQIPFWNGFLCSTSQVRRIAPAVIMDPNGAASYALNFGAPYASAIVPGASLNFQLWYRDAGSANLSDAVRIDFH